MELSITARGPETGDADGGLDAATSREVERYEEIARDLAAGWRMSDRGREAVARVIMMTSTKHALYAHAPLVCKGEASPCAALCDLVREGMAPYGERCPYEVVALHRYFNAYCNELGVDIDNMVDLGLVKELAEVEVQLERISKRLAQDDWIQEVAVGTDRNGLPITRPEIHKAFEIQERLRNRKDKILDLLMATRKAKASMKESDTMDPSRRAAMLLEKAREMAAREAAMMQADIIDVEPQLKDESAQETDEAEDASL